MFRIWSYATCVLIRHWLANSIEIGSYCNQDALICIQVNELKIRLAPHPCEVPITMEWDAHRRRAAAAAAGSQK
ncbi:hypothetical protein BDR26DRAFT_930840 [Obelidium mucronatum]|nr:hypothetical protein BDR26DRAFT_930840 [Obelidium mucronatum]